MKLARLLGVPRPGPAGPWCNLNGLAPSIARSMAGLRVICVLPRKLGCDDSGLRVLETALQPAGHVVADRYGQNLRWPVTLNGASSFKPAVHKALTAV